MIKCLKTHYAIYTLKVIIIIIFLGEKDLKRYVDYGPRCHCFDGVFGLRLDVKQIGNISKF